MTLTSRVAGVVAGFAGIAWCAAGLAAQEAPKPPPSVAGKWVLTLVTENMTATPALELKQNGEKITGAYTSSRYGSFPLEGTLKGRAIEFAVTLTAEGTTVVMSFRGEVAADGQTMKGKAALGDMGEATWTAERPKMPSSSGAGPVFSSIH